MSLKDIKNTELELLMELNKVCEKNNLNLYLCGGTLLGAVRHKGFIPWDDDIDVCLLRNDYNKLIELYNNNKLSFSKNVELKCEVCKIYGKTAFGEKY